MKFLIKFCIKLNIIDDGIFLLITCLSCSSSFFINSSSALRYAISASFLARISSTNEILAYNLSNSLAIDIVTETINKLVKLKSFKLHKDAFIHSDQGSHYTSPIFQKLLKKYNLGQSMSRRGNCWDNAPQESFFGHMKDEIDYKSCETIEELKILIDDYMDYYNNERCQWNLKKLTPVQYRNQLLVTS